MSAIAANGPSKAAAAAPAACAPPDPLSPLSDDAAVHPVPGVASASNSSEAQLNHNLLPLNPSATVGIAVPQVDLEEEAKEEAQRLKEGHKFEEQFVGVKRQSFSAGAQAIVQNTSVSLTVLLRGVAAAAVAPFSFLCA